MIPWFKSGNLRKLEDDRDILKAVSVVKMVNLGLSEYAVKLLAAGCGACSDDLSTVCEAHDTDKQQAALEAYLKVGGIVTRMRLDEVS